MKLHRPGRRGRIIGGADIDIQKAPWHAQVRKNGIYKCGGSIVEENWILTAAHCVEGDVKENKYTVVVGNAEKENTAEKIKVIKVVRNPDFDAATSDNDFAMLKLEESLTVGESIKVVSMAKSGFTVTKDMKGFVTGWGGKDPSVDSVNNLQSVEVTVISQSDCKIYYKVMENTNPVTTNMTCAGDIQNGGKDCKLM